MTVTSCSNRSTAAAAETAEFRAKLAACDEIHEEVVGEYQTLQSASCIVYSLQITVVVGLEPNSIDLNNIERVNDDYIDERSAD